MLLTIHKLPSTTLYQDVKTLIKDKCGITNIIVDNLQYEGKTKKVTLGLVNEDDAAIVSRKINGLVLNGEQLYVENVGKNKSTEQPHKSSSTVTSQQQNQYYQASQYNYQSPNMFVPGMVINQALTSQMMTQPGTNQMMSQPGTNQMMAQPGTSNMVTNDFNYGSVYMPVPAPTSYMGSHTQVGMLSGPSTMSSFQPNWGQQSYSGGNTQSKTYENNVKNVNSNSQQQNYNEWNQISVWENSTTKRPLERESLNDYQNNDYTKNVGRNWAPQNNRGNAEPVWERSYSNDQSREDEGSKRKRKRKNKPSEGQRQFESNNRQFQWNYNTSNDNRSQNKFNAGVKTDTFVSRNRQRDSSPQNFTNVSNNKQSEWTSSKMEQNHDAGRRNPISQWEPRSYGQLYEQNPGKSNYSGANTFDANSKSQKQDKDVFEKKPTDRTGYSTDPYHYYAKAPSSTSKNYPDKTYEKPPHQMPFYCITPKYDTFESNKSNVNVSSWRDASMDPQSSERRSKKSKKWENANTDYLMNRYARKTGTRPVPTKSLTDLLRKDFTWRGQAVSQILRQILIHNKGRVNKNLKFQLKTCIKSRVDVVLGDAMGVQVHDIIQRYRKKFRQIDDVSFLNAIKDKVKAYEKAEQERLEKEKEKEKAKESSNEKPVDHEEKDKEKEKEQEKEKEKEKQTEKEKDEKPQQKLPEKKKKVKFQNKIPKYPKDKKHFKQMKKDFAKEFTKEDPYEMEPTLKRALNDELNIIQNLMVTECSDDFEGDFGKIEFQFIAGRLKEMSIPEVKKLIRLMTTKRLLNIRTNLSFLVFGDPKLPQKQYLLTFLKKYGVISLKKSCKHKMYTGTCDTFDNYDRVLQLKTANIGGCPVKIKPFQLTGPLEKFRRSDIKAVRDRRIQMHLEKYDLNVDVGQRKPRNKNENNDQNKNQANETVSSKNGDAENCQDNTNKGAEEIEHDKILEELQGPSGMEDNESNKETDKDNEHNKETEKEGDGNNKDTEKGDGNNKETEKGDGNNKETEESDGNKETEKEGNGSNNQTDKEVNEQNEETGEEVNENIIENDKELNENNEEIEMNPDWLTDDMKSDENENHVDDEVDEEDDYDFDNIKEEDLEDY